MAYFPNPPIVTIATTPWVLPGSEVPTNFGPWVYGGALWAVGTRQAGPLTPAVIKSTNGGTTWTAQDNANSPANLNEGNAQSDYWPDLVNGIIHMVGYRSGASANNLSYCTFNLNTGLYGTTIDGAIRCGSAHIRLRANGTPIAIFLPITGGGDGSSVNLPIRYSLISSGVFQTPVDWVPAVAGREQIPISTLLDTAGTLHLYYTNHRASDISIDQIRHTSLTSADVISASQLISTTLNVARHTYLGVSQEFGGALYVGEADIATTNQSVRVWQGTPSAAPVWSEVLTVPMRAGQGSGTKIAQIIPFGSGISVWWFDQLNNQSSLLGYYSTTLDGITWSAPILAWDVLNNPVTTGPTPAEPVQMFSVALNSGGVQMVAGAYITVGFDLSLVFLTSPMTVSCANPPQGQVGQFYAHTFTETGGTAPFTWGIGGFIPPGLSLNSSTGVISGIPTIAGNYTFSITVTDTNGATASVTCTIVIIGFVLDCNNPPAGTVGVAYIHFLEVIGGTAPFLFTLVSGALPDGLTLGSVSGGITGTPTASGTFTFTIHVIDANGLQSQVTCTITIATVCDANVNPQIPGIQVPIDADTELYLRRFINDMSGAMTPSDQN